MTDNAKKFLAAVSQDEALKKEFEGVKGLEAMLKIAKAHGFELTAEDFTPSDMEKLSEDEMKAVAGGAFLDETIVYTECKCSKGGEGLGPKLHCTCTDMGEGFYVGPPIPRPSKMCHCVETGYGRHCI